MRKLCSAFMVITMVLLSSAISTAAQSENTVAIVILETTPPYDTQSAKRYQIRLYADGTYERTGIPLPETSTEIDQLPVTNWQERILAQAQPLSGPREFIPVPGTEQKEALFVMTGPQDQFVNLYWIQDDDIIQQLTSAENISEEPVLSATVIFVAWRPEHPGQFLYRSRIRDFSGQEANQLWIYDLTDNSTQPAPYMGDFPTWSPDGFWLTGVRLDTTLTPPLYQLWIENINTGETQAIDYACHPHWSPDGAWLIYHGHNNSQWQGYTACYSSGDVFALAINSQQKVELSAGLDQPVQIVDIRVPETTSEER